MVHSPHGVVSLGAPMQAMPSPAFGTAYPRVLDIWCAASSHSLQSDHWAQTQSTLVVSTKQVAFAAVHSPISSSEVSHSKPSTDGGISTALDRIVDPVPHVTEHGDQSDQSVRTQSCGPVRFWQAMGEASSSLGLHLAGSVRVPLHCLPVPVALTAIPLDLVLVPSHAREQVDHSPQFPSSQSALSLHSCSVPQVSYSSLLPAAGAPQKVSLTARSRVRFLMPPPHVAEHTLHSCQSSHSPSTQHFGWPKQFLAIATSLCALGLHKAPLPLGSAEKPRVRVL
mmetsp:Transcript_64443/g.153776  ORF Transcript_64443/g.153776 Transcript_64443/m.153776 type:complete len:282 (-) Transcript_64443:3724-4569(-)